jgi:hypothetical protein
VINSPPPQLDYAPPLSLVTRIGRRRLIWVGVVIAVVIAINNWGYPLMQRVKRWHAERAYHRLQKTCMAYAAPADRVVYEEDPAEAEALLKLGPQYTPIFSIPSSAIVCPTLQPPVRFTEALWTSYSAGVTPTAPAAQGVAFMGERTTKAGERRLVCVGIAMELRPEATASRYGMNRWLQAWSFEIGSLASADQTAPMGQMVIDSGAPRPPGETDPLAGDLRKPYNPPFPLRLYAGQPDPNDASRFTIPYALVGHRGVITGTLNDDGSILLTPDIGWHGQLGMTVSWTPKIPNPTTATRPATHPTP